MSSKTSLHKWLVSAAVIGTFSLLFLLSKGLYLNPNKTSSPIVGQNARDFHLNILQGSELLLGHKTDYVNLSELKGSPLILNFWASWCSTCAGEASILESFWKKHGGDKMRVIGIAVHDKKDDVLSFLKTAGKTFAIAIDEEGKISLNYGVTGVPETVFINAQGVVIHKEVGPLTTALLEKMFLKLK